MLEEQDQLLPPPDTGLSAGHDIELDGVRIRNLARARQASARFSSYCLIGALACAVGSIDLIWRAIRRIKSDGSIIRPVIYLITAALLAWISRKLYAKSRQLSREAQHKALPEPALPPDFSTLSDGSHIARNLERME